MKYSIFYLIKGNAEKYHQKLVKEVGPKFGERYLIENPLPSHITIKVPFEFEKHRIKKIERLLNEFVKKQKLSKIKINGFGNFDRHVAFLKIKPSKQAIKIQKELLKGIKKINEVKLNGFDIKWHPHSTISYGNTKESFNGIWRYLKKLEKPKFELNFDNITIMKKQGKYWKVYREFKIR